MDIEGAVVLVTGANRGIGAAFVEQLKKRGAAKIYAAARDSSTVDVDGVHPLDLDVTNAAQIDAAAAAAIWPALVTSSSSGCTPSTSMALESRAAA